MSRYPGRPYRGGAAAANARPRPGSQQRPTRPANDNILGEVKFPKPGPGALAILRGGQPIGLAYDIVDAGFPDLGGDDVIAPQDNDLIIPWQGYTPLNQSNAAWPSGWTVVCTQGTECFSGPCGQRFPSSAWWSTIGSSVPSCISQCSQAIATQPIGDIGTVPSGHHTVVVGRRNVDGGVTCGSNRFHSNTTMHRVSLGTPAPEYNPGPNAPAKPQRSYPLSDPMLDPEVFPDTLPNPQPWPRPNPRPNPEPSKAPSTAPMPNPTWPVPVVNPGPGLARVNGPTTTITVGRNGVDTDGSWNLAPGTNPKRPNKRTKEIKVRMLSAGRWVWVKLNSATEALDLIDSMFDALPEKTQFKAFYKVPVRGIVKASRPIKNYKGEIVGWEDYERPARPGETRWTTDPYHKAAAVYDNWDEVNVEVALENFVNNQIEDFMYGNVFNEKIVNQTTGQATGGAGVFLGSEEVMFKAPTVDIDLETGSFDLTWDTSTQLRR